MAILIHTRQRRNHKVFAVLKQLILTGFCILFLGQAGAWAGEVYDMKLFWPFPTQKILNFRHYDGDGQPAKGYWGEPVIEHAWMEAATEGGNQYIIFHHWWDTWCPQIMDRMVWVGDGLDAKLYYTDTWHFGTNFHTEFDAPLGGHVWADRYMTGDAEPLSDVYAGRVNQFEHENCVLTTSEVYWEQTGTTTRQLLEAGQTEWSHYTDTSPGEMRMVPVVRMIAETHFFDNPEDVWREIWSFIYVEDLGRYIPIRTQGEREVPGQEGVIHLWDARLVNMDDI